MIRSFVVPSFVLLVLIACFSTTTSANIIGIGMDWRSGVFVQEYWENGEPRYLLANLSKEDVEITAHEFDSTWRIGQPLAKKLAGPWKVAAGTQISVDAKPLLGEGLRRFYIKKNQPLGVLYSPAKPDYEGEGCITTLGLNGSGGKVDGLYVVQSKMELAGGSTAKIVLQIPSKSGVLKFKRTLEANTDPLRPESLVVDSATCDTLAISREDKEGNPPMSYVVIDTDSPKADTKSHTVVLDVVLPKVKSPQLYMFDGWLARPGGGGNGVTRGLVVVEKKD